MRAALLAALAFAAVPAAQADESCNRVLRERIAACAAACVERARAAVSPEVRNRVKGYGCVNNCSKLEMFNGHSCPADR